MPLHTDAIFKLKHQSVKWRREVTVLEVAVDTVGYIQLIYYFRGSGTQRLPHSDSTQLLQAQRITCQVEAQLAKAKLWAVLNNSFFLTLNPNWSRYLLS